MPRRRAGHAWDRPRAHRPNRSLRSVFSRRSASAVRTNPRASGKRFAERASPPLVAGIMDQGMSAGAAMAFVVAGGVSSIPAMTAVFALVKRQVFAAYIGLGFTGAVLSGLAYGTFASFA